MEYTVTGLHEDDLPDLDAALLAEYQDLARHNYNVLLACFRWDPEGWFVAKAMGQRVGFVGGCAMNESEAVIGYYMVMPDFRRKGIGKALWVTLARYLGKRNVCLTSVESSLQYNLDMGFTHNPFNVLCVHCDPTQAKYSHPPLGDTTITQYEPHMFDDVMTYDSDVHVIPREAFLLQWLDPNHAKTVVAYVKGKIIGYGTIQLLSNGLLMVAPVFADDDVTADAILCHVFDEARSRGKGVVMDVVESNEYMSGCRERFGIEVQSREYRMCDRRVPDSRLEKAYVLTTDSFSLL